MKLDKTDCLTLIRLVNIEKRYLFSGNDHNPNDPMYKHLTSLEKRLNNSLQGFINWEKRNET